MVPLSASRPAAVRRTDKKTDNKSYDFGTAVFRSKDGFLLVQLNFKFASYLLTYEAKKFFYLE